MIKNLTEIRPVFEKNSKTNVSELFYRNRVL